MGVRTQASVLVEHRNPLSVWPSILFYVVLLACIQIWHVRVDDMR